MDSLNRESETIMNKLNASKAIGDATVKELQRLSTQVKTDITEQYEMYQEELMERADDEKDRYRQWLDQLTTVKMPEVNVLQDFNKAKKELEEERLLLKSERQLLDKLKREVRDKF